MLKEITKGKNDRNSIFHQDHPEEMWRNMYRYYRRKGPKVDVRLVLAVTITLISAGLCLW